MSGDGPTIRGVRVRSVLVPVKRPLITPVTAEDGHVLIPDTPGAGIAWNEDAVEKYSVAF